MYLSEVTYLPPLPLLLSGTCPLNRVMISKDTDHSFSWCHFLQNTVVRDLTRKNNRYHAMKPYSYMVFRKPLAEDEEAKPVNYGRIIRSPIRGGKHVLMDICSPDMTLVSVHIPEAGD